MSVHLSDDELRMELDFNRNPLEQIKETSSEWLLGTWTLSKSHRTWRVGYAHPIVSGAAVGTFAFDLDGKQGVGVLFESADQPPWIFVGWVPTARARDAEKWAEFLNAEIANRLAGRAAAENWTYDAHDGSTAQDIEDETADRKLEKSLGVKPFKRP